ncbi:MAG: LptF/LptG family permease [Rhodothalassiaceae bacterium]
MSPIFGRIDRYVAAKTTTPLLATMVITAALLLLERMLRLFDFVVNEHGPIDVVWRMLAHLVPHHMGMAIPVGLFLGTLLTMRSLSLSSEFDAAMAGGTGLQRLMRPILAIALLLVAVDIWLIGFQQPYSRYAYRRLDYELRSGALGASIEVGRFVRISDHILLRVGDSREKGRELLNLFLRREISDGREIVATARRGAFFATANDQTVLLRLYDGRLVDFDPSLPKPRVLSFQSQDIVVDLPANEAFRRRGGEELEMTLPELFAAQSDKSLDGESRNHFRGNLNWRLIHLATLLVIPFFAAPLGIADKRSGASGGMVAGLALLIVYNELLEAGERAVANGTSSPLTGQWTLFIAFALIAGFIFYTAISRPGRGIAGIVDRVATMIIWPARRLIDAIRGAV